MREEEMQQRGFLLFTGEPGVMPEMHWHREIEFNIFFGGEVTYLFGGKRIHVSTGQVNVFWAMIPHQLIYAEPETRYYCIHLPLARFLQWGISQDFTSHLLHGEMIREHNCDRQAADSDLFQRWSADITTDPTDINHVILLELEARLRRLAWNFDLKNHSHDNLRCTSSISDSSLEKIEKMILFITENYTEPISGCDIAHAGGLHPKYASHLFHERCGITLHNYLTQQRLSHAQRLLATTDSKVVDVAFASGFGSISQFYTAFTRSYNQTPKSFQTTQR